MKAAITKIDKITQSKTSLFFNVKIEVEPKSVEQTSPVIFAEAEKIFIINIRQIARSSKVPRIWRGDHCTPTVKSQHGK